MDFNATWVLIRKDGRSQTIVPGMMFVGREECDLILQSASADKRHAVIFFDNSKNEIHIKDLNSLTGTYVNGMRISEQTYVKLKNLDNLRFGYGPDVFHVQNCGTPTPAYSVPKKDSFVKIKAECSSPSHTTTSLPPIEKCDSTNLEQFKAKIKDSLEDLKSLENLSTTNNLKYKRSDTQILSSPSTDLKDYTKHPKVEPGCSDFVPRVRSETNVVSSEEKPQSSEEPNKFPESDANEDDQDIPNSCLAFTVAFDNQTPNTKKKFSIRDSISKYAPRKIETPKQSKEKPVENANKNTVKNPVPETGKEVQVELRRKKSASGKMEENRHSAEKKNIGTKLSQGANFLIQKMFKDDSKANPDTKNELSSESKKDNSLEPKVLSPTKNEDQEDNKSDTGTYTIEDELNAKVVKEAREKIDEVFGIPIPENVSSVTENIMESLDSNYKEKPCLSLERTDVIQTAEDPKVKQETVTAPPRTKRRLPTPPIKTPSDNESSPTEDSPSPCGYNLRSRSQNLYKKSNFQLGDSRPLSKSPSLPKDMEISRMPSSRITNKNRLTLDNLELLQNSCKGARSGMVNGHGDSVPSRRTPPSAGHFQHRGSWNMSGSDMDLDQLRVETSSVLSDVSASTEPPSIQPASRRTDNGPTMKFNRAFALRRARLGLDTDLVTPSREATTKDEKSTKVSNRLSPASTGLGLSRQDGGRFGLRLPKSASRSITNKSNTNNSPPVSKPSVASTMNKFGHRRTDSDPAKTAFLRKGIDQKMSLSQSNKLKANSIRPAFQRAASFSNNGDIEMESNLQKSSNWKSESQPHALLRQIPRASMTRESISLENELQMNRENRASPRLQNKPPLSAIDNVVIQATHNLSSKLRTIAYRLLIKERDKFTEDSNERLMIDEVLPRVCDNNTCSTCVDRGVSQELSSILKNLTKVEQSLEVLTLVIDEERLDPRRLHQHRMQNTEDNIYVVNV